jgi:aldehyde:ferredoxin oxidoreductase
MSTDEKLIRVDMSDLSVSIVPFPEAWRLLGGRALTVRILLDECDPLCDPLGPDNVFIMAPGVLAGSAAPTSGRISFGAKSPLTGGIKEANAGGNPSQDIMKLGYRGIVLTGKPADSSLRFGLDIDAAGVSLKTVPDCAGLWNYALIDTLAERYSKTTSFICIGPAGEQLLTGASVACTDQEQSRHPARHAARGGLGAVMGSKGLKYVAIDAARSKVRKAGRSKEFNKLCKARAREYVDGPQAMKYGTSTSVPMANALYTFPYKNRIEGQSPDFETLDGMNIVKSFEERGGGMHNCLTGCVVQCSNIVHDAEGNYKTSALEFETITLLGANCAIQSWEDVADLDRLCDEVGLDTIEVGAAIAIYMESGGLEWGDAEGAKKLLHEIADGTELGKVIGNGAAATGRKTGVKRIPTVRGQAIPAWDPRPLKATGVTYATSAQGADHTAGLVVSPGLPAEDMPKISQDNQIINALIDSSGFCMFLGVNPEDIRLFYNAFCDVNITRDEIYEMGWKCISDEWEFNRRAGIAIEEECMPECMKTDGVGPQKAVFDVDQSIVVKTFERFGPDDEFFTKRGVA